MSLLCYIFTAFDIVVAVVIHIVVSCYICKYSVIVNLELLKSNRLNDNVVENTEST